MTRKIDKVLSKLAKKERKVIEECVTKLISGKTKELNIKKLKGHSDIFRIRKGSLRILYRIEGKEIFILAIERKREDTYKNL